MMSNSSIVQQAIREHPGKAERMNQILLIQFTVFIVWNGSCVASHADDRHCGNDECSAGGDRMTS